ncbi:MAG: ComEC/Rec2 family competence protein [Candidatus Dojkabacteria bacterium]
MGWILLSILLLSVFSALFLKLRNIRKKKKEIGVFKTEGKGNVYFFVHLLIFVLIVIVSTVKVCKVLSRIEKTNEKVLSFTDRRVVFEGYIADEPVKKHRFQHLNTILLEDLYVEDERLDRNHGKILVKVENYEKFTVGEVCKFYGTLVEPENFDDFDYKRFLNNKDIFLILEDTTYNCFDIKKRRAGSVLKNRLLDLKENLVERIDGILLEPQSSLLTGMLFGKERLFEQDFDDSIRISGVSHVVSASGYSVTIVVLIVNRVFFFLPKKVKIALGFLAIWLFALFSGLSTSITRACIMNSLSLLALFWGRSNSINISLPFTAAIFVFFKPLILLDVGFLLSISAALGLFYILPILLDVKKRFSKKFKFTENYLLPTMSCTLSTLPISLLTFKTFSIWAVPVNMIIQPVMEGILLWGVLSILIFTIHRPLSYFFLSVIDLKLSYFEYVIQFVSRLNFGVWKELSLMVEPLSLLLFVTLFLLVIYYYPVEHEEYNYYLKDR